MSNERRVRVALYWGGDIIYESDTVRYSCGARFVVKLPLNVEYDWLVRNLHIRMKTNPNELRLVISGRWPFSTVQGNARYSEIPILDNESLQDFVVAPDTVRYMMNLDLLEMYIKTEVLDVVEPSHNLNAPSLNLNEPHLDLYEPSADFMSSFPKFQSFTSFLSQGTTPQIDVPSNRYGHGRNNFGINFDVGNYNCHDFGDGAGTSRSPQVSDIPRVTEIQARVEVDSHADAHFGEGVDDSDSDVPNNAYESDEVGDSGDDMIMINIHPIIYHKTHYFTGRTFHVSMIFKIVQRCMLLPVNQRVLAFKFGWMIKNLILSPGSCSLVRRD
ncbi:uncharacterized protein LOC132060674 [Lycium ferocissimum]|uniref:uncharacterized protein LOC132060674 n=1 Tax=Lycium ferocissimum TaxID=112874 RepID=UPI0028157E9B|nr:uncharacterized protein LOC132060674 [Lycium ferocissimum]